MSLKSFFPEQFDQLKAFFISATEVVRHLKIDPEMRPLLLRALGKMDDDKEFPHALTLCSQAFKEPVSYFEGLFEILRQSYEQNAKSLSNRQIKLVPPLSPEVAMKAPEKLVRYASSLAASLPDDVGSLVFVLNPDEIADPQSFRRSIRYLAENTRSHWVKFLVLDSRSEPMLDDMEGIETQTFHLSPEEIEKRAREDLQSPAALSAAEQRQYKGLLAGFAHSNKEYDRAAQLQRDWASDAERDQQPGEAASAYYNLGNTLLAKGDFAQATEVFCKACDICVEHKVNGLAPFVYVNLGVSLHRQNQFEPAFAALKVGRDMFKAQNHRAGEAFVVDALAQMYALDGRTAEAERSWRYCLTLYDGMTSSTFKDVREAGRKDVIAKLKNLGVNIDQGRAEATRP